MRSFIFSGIVGGLAGGAAVSVLALLLPRKKCPKCSCLLPRFRKPNNGREAVFGGLHCPNCNAQIAPNGFLLSE